jgi:hypothetical protein
MSRSYVQQARHKMNNLQKDMARGSTYSIEGELDGNEMKNNLQNIHRMSNAKLPNTTENPKSSIFRYNTNSPNIIPLDSNLKNDSVNSLLNEKDSRTERHRSPSPNTINTNRHYNYSPNKVNKTDIYLKGIKKGMFSYPKNSHSTHVSAIKNNNKILNESNNNHIQFNESKNMIRQQSLDQWKFGIVSNLINSKSMPIPDDLSLSTMKKDDSANSFKFDISRYKVGSKTSLNNNNNNESISLNISSIIGANNLLNSNIRENNGKENNHMNVNNVSNISNFSNMMNHNNSNNAKLLKLPSMSPDHRRRPSRDNSFNHLNLSINKDRYTTFSNNEEKGPYSLTKTHSKVDLEHKEQKDQKQNIANKSNITNKSNKSLRPNNSTKGIEIAKLPHEKETRRMIIEHLKYI